MWLNNNNNNKFSLSLNSEHVIASSNTSYLIKKKKLSSRLKSKIPDRVDEKKKTKNRTLISVEPMTFLRNIFSITKPCGEISNFMLNAS